MKRAAVLFLCVLASVAHGSEVDDALAQLRGDSDGLKAHLTPRGTVTEFFNTTLKHYFRTVDPAEVAGIRAGTAGPGWALTNDNFPAWDADFKPVNALPVCRFYAAGPNSHFFTISASECAIVKTDPGWHYEGTAFYAYAPVGAGSCPPESTPVYRAYNNRFPFNDSNHRFTTSAATYQSMIAQGWAGEGVVMCAPLPTTADQQQTEKLIGGTWVIPYRLGVTNFIDNLTFVDVITSTADGSILAQGFNKFNLIAVGQYSASSAGWVALASYTTTGGYPYDAYRMTITGNVMTGCYYFVAAPGSSTAGCATPFTGSR